MGPHYLFIGFSYLSMGLIIIKLPRPLDLDRTALLDTDRSNCLQIKHNFAQCFFSASLVCVREYNVPCPPTPRVTDLKETKTHVHALRTK